MYFAVFINLFITEIICEVHINKADKKKKVTSMHKIHNQWYIAAQTS